MTNIALDLACNRLGIACYKPNIKRTFILLILALFCGGATAFSRSIPKLGVASSMDNDSILYRSGYGLIGESVAKLLSPKLSNDQFAQGAASLKKLRCKIYMCNVFFPGDLKIAGDNVDEQRVLTFADTVLSRASKFGIRAIVLGSGGARRLPEGYDVQKATEAFIKLAGKIAILAGKHHVKIFLESLNHTETNFINTLEQAAHIVKSVNHPNFRLNADIYHMLKENEPPQHIIDAANVIEYCEIAEKDERTYPGFKGDDFVPYFKALKQIKYKGYIFIEARWTNLATEAPKAKEYLTRQLKIAYQE